MRQGARAYRYYRIEWTVKKMIPKELWEEITSAVDRNKSEVN